MIQRRDRRERHSHVARRTVVAACNVIYGFSDRLHAVMASHAPRRHRTVVHDDRQAETGRGMANVAVILGYDVIDVLADGELVVVTARALLRQSLEHTVAMARLTGKMRMQTDQRKAGGHVIEFFGSFDNAAQGNLRHNNRQQHQNPSPAQNTTATASGTPLQHRLPPNYRNHQTSVSTPCSDFQNLLGNAQAS